jgi:hypothetical protein
MNAQLAQKQRTSRAAKTVPILDEDITTVRAWTRDTIKEEDWLLPIPERMLDEVRAMLGKMRTDPLPMLLQQPSHYELPEATSFFRQVRQILDHGVGFVLIDRLPIEDMSEEEAKSVYWVLSSLIGRPVAQKWNGTMMMDVRDSGKKPTPGSGVRLSQTSVDLAYHSDNAHNDEPAEYVGLLSLKIAREGGLSSVMSFCTVHNYLRRHHPDRLTRLYKPFFWDRMLEHRPDDSALFNAPIFRYVDGELQARLGTLQIRNAYALLEGGMDPATEEALAALDDAFSRENNAVSMMMQPGQIQFLNNRIIGHSRTEFVDFDETALKRHLIRIWLRENGTPHYRGAI